MIKNKKIMAAAVMSVMVLSLAACGTKTETPAAPAAPAAPSAPAAPAETDHNAAMEGVEAFNAIVKAYPDRKGFHEELQHWGFELEPGVKFEWSKDMSANIADFALVMKSEPLVGAGLDLGKLDKDSWLVEPAGKDSMGMEQPARLILPYDVSEKAGASETSEESLMKIIEADEELLIYHEDQKHYVLILGNGNEVVWTEDPALNENDVLFVLGAAPLVEAGLDVTKLEGTGWTFKPATADGKFPDQIVSTYDLKK